MNALNGRATMTLVPELADWLVQPPAAKPVN